MQVQNPFKQFATFCGKVNSRLREFSRRYDSALFSRKKEDIQSCLSLIYAKKKASAQAAKLIIVCFFKGQVDVIKQLAKADEIRFPGCTAS